MNEFTILAIVTIITALMWVPYVLDRISRQGLLVTVGYPEVPAQSPWAERAKRAHANAIENLVVFATLLIILYLQGAFDPLTLLASKIYGVARFVHFFVYMLRIPWLRTLAYFAGFAAQMMLAVKIFAS